MLEETTTQHIELKVPTTLKALIEALIFAAHEPLTIAQIRSIYQGETKRDESRTLDGETIRKIIDELNQEYTRDDRPYRIVSIAGGYQFATRSEYAEWLGRLHREQGRKKLSQSGIETLAIIAYKQPITKAEIEKIRGVNCDYVLKTLLEKELITVVGRSETVGRPLLYGTTREFLKHFGLNDITDLPRPREIEEILGESQFETERRMLEAQAAADAAKKEVEEFKSRLPHIPKKKADLNQREAQIFARQRVREIKIVRKAQEENTQQETITFQTENENKQESPATVEIADIETTTTTTIDVHQNTEIREEVQEPKPPHPYQDVYQEHAIPESDTSTERTMVEEQDFRGGSDHHAESGKDTVEVVQDTPAPATKSLETIDTTPTEAVGIDQSKSTSIREEGIQEHQQPQRKTRWRVWKEKVQNFLKKLFD